MKFNLFMDFMVTSDIPKKPVIDVSHDENELPSIRPMHFSIGIEPSNVYTLDSLFRKCILNIYNLDKSKHSFYNNLSSLKKFQEPKVLLNFKISRILKHFQKVSIDIVRNY